MPKRIQSLILFEILIFKNHNYFEKNLTFPSLTLLTLTFASNSTFATSVCPLMAATWRRLFQQKYYQSKNFHIIDFDSQIITTIVIHSLSWFEGVFWSSLTPICYCDESLEIQDWNSKLQSLHSEGKSNEIGKNSSSKMKKSWQNTVEKAKIQFQFILSN